MIFAGGVLNSVKSLDVIGSNERSIMETIHKEFYFQSERRNVTSLQLWELISSTLRLSKRNMEYLDQQFQNLLTWHICHAHFRGGVV